MQGGTWVSLGADCSLRATVAELRLKRLKKYPTALHKPNRLPDAQSQFFQTMLGKWKKHVMASPSLPAQMVSS
jgi:hypothetical protein